MKPEFWSDEKLAPMEPIDRLVFLGLISMADDAGRLLDSVKVVDAFIFPYTNHTSANSLDVLANASRIRRGVTAHGQRVIQITHWEKHQRVDHPNYKASFPELIDSPSVTAFREDVASHSREIRDSTYDLRPVPTTADRRPDIPESVTTAAASYLTDPKTRTARLGILRGLLQGMAGTPIPEAAIVRGLTDMAAAGAEFRPVVVRKWAVRAQSLLEGEAGAHAAREAIAAQSSVLGHPNANTGHSSFAEDDLE